MSSALHSDTVLIAIMLSAAIAVLVAGGMHFCLSLYLARKHPALWKQFGAPRLVFAMGRRYNPLGAWLDKEEYKAAGDQFLLRWCPVVRRAQRFGIAYFIAALAILLAILLLRQFV